MEETLLKPRNNTGIAGAVYILLYLFAALFIGYPFVRTFMEAAGPGGWREAFESPYTLRALGNSLLLAVLSTVFSLLCGYLYAYSVARCRFPRPLRRFFEFIPVLHLISPPFVGGLSFILLFGRQGLFTRTLLGLDISLYGLPGLVIAQTLCYFPIAYLILKNAVGNNGAGGPAALEYAAANLGAARGRAWASVTLPLSLHSVAAAALFIAISSISDFANPMLIGGRYRVLAVELYTALTGWGDAATAACLGVLLLVPALVLFFLFRRLTRNGTESLATLGSSSSSNSLEPPPPALYARILLILFCVFFAVVILAQFFAIVAGAFSKVWGVNPAFTVAHLQKTLRYTGELINTFVYALLAAFCSALLSALAAFFSGRTRFFLRGLLDALATLPAAIPGSLLGLSLVLAFNEPPIAWTGTAAIIVVSMIVYELPAAYKMMQSGLSGIKTTLDESARSLGASPLGAAAVVVFAARGSLASAFVYTFVRACGTVSAVIFLVSFNTKLISVTILNLAAQGDWGVAASLALSLTVVIFIVLGVLFAFSRRVST
jgi:iron(III) transport system permease protein